MQKKKVIKLVPTIFVGISMIVIFNPSRYVDGLSNDWKKIFGISGENTDESIRPKNPPQFMTELYNTIADPLSGVARGKNPHNAKIVRSFVEKETQFSHLYLFDIIDGLEINETIIEAELHLFRKRSDPRDIHPTILKSPYYLIRVYQVLEGKNMDVPDAHRLLNVHYVSAHASGWQVFNVKQALLTWLTGAKNLGLLVTASTVFGDEVTIEFSRYDDYRSNNANKQPILVLFIDDGRRKENNENVNNERIHGVPNYDKYNDDDDEDTNNDDRGIDEKPEENMKPKFPEDCHSGSTVDRQKRELKDNEHTIDEASAVLNKQFVDNGPQFQLDEIFAAGQIDLFQRQKRINREDRLDGSTSQKRVKNVDKFVTPKRTTEERLRSMDIYERAMLREELEKKSVDYAKQTARNNYKRKMSLRRRLPRDAEMSYYQATNITECTRTELYIDFEVIGLSNWIIAPNGYSAFHCRGSCDYMSRDNSNGKITNHANVQAIVHKTRLVGNVDMPCCVPTKLLDVPLLYYDDNDNVVLKVYEDMIADKCGCQ